MSEHTWSCAPDSCIGDLTLDEVRLDTLDYFGWRCSYCLRADFACLDHYVPVVQGGGTTQGNCVPACASCNSAKGGRAPQGYLIKASAFTRVALYLAQFES